MCARRSTVGTLWARCAVPLIGRGVARRQRGLVGHQAVQVRVRGCRGVRRPVSDLTGALLLLLLLHELLLLPRELLLRRPRLHCRLLARRRRRRAERRLWIGMLLGGVAWKWWGRMHGARRVRRQGGPRRHRRPIKGCKAIR